MKVHHLNCGSFCPHTVLLDEITHCHCILLEFSDQLVLIDTGIGKSHANILLNAQSKIAGVDFDKFKSAKEQILKLGFKLDDVRHILITHLDYDHAGGISDFPNATVHISKRELDTANKVRSIARYHSSMWKNHRKMIAYNDFGENWNGFECIRQLPGLPPEILMIPLYGHSAGHSGFAFKANSTDWIFHVGDAYLNQLEFKTGLKSMQYKTFARLNCDNNQERLRNLKKIESLRQNKKAVVLSSHDPHDFNKFF